MRDGSWAASALIVALAAACSGGDDDGMTDLGELDARCESLCADGEPACAEDVILCEQLCQVRVANVESLCATCLLENANGGVCPGGTVCCPDPSFPSGVLDCAGVCAGSAGVNPGSQHPVCIDLCSTDEPECAEDAGRCADECAARIRDVSGLCANCLLEGAHGGPCVPGVVCCPDPTFPTSAADCAVVCSN